MTTDPCAHREWTDMDDDIPTGPQCTEQAEFTCCEPIGARVCLAHRCRCSRPLFDVKRANWAEQREARITTLMQERDMAIHDKIEALATARMWEKASMANRSEIERWAADDTKLRNELAAVRAVLDKLPRCEVNNHEGPCPNIATVRFSDFTDHNEYRCDNHRVRVDFDLRYATELRALAALEKAK